MASTSQRLNRGDGLLSTLDVFVQTLNLAKDTCGIVPAQAASDSAGALLTTIRVCLSLRREDKPLTRVV